MLRTGNEAIGMPYLRAVSVHRLWLGFGWVVLAIVLWGTLTPEPPGFISPPLPQFDKVEHFGAFLFLNAWFIAAQPTRRRWWLLTLAFIALGGLIEIVQGWSGFRDGDWYDWYADISGALLGAWWPSLWLARLHGYMVIRTAPAS
jgi:VanZ family protein